jgi:hypothetical protein
MFYYQFQQDNVSDQIALVSQHQIEITGNISLVKLDLKGKCICKHFLKTVQDGLDGDVSQISFLSDIFVFILPF